MGNQFKRKFKAEIEAFISAHRAFMDAGRALDDAIQPALGDIMYRKDKADLRELIEAMPCSMTRAILTDMLDNEMG